MHVCAVDGLHSSGRLNTEYTIQEGVPEAKYAYRVHAHAHRAQHTSTHVSMWCLA